MSVHSGGYQTGRSYTWYRSMGHGPLGALWMRYGSVILGIELYALWLFVVVLWALVFAGVIR